MQTKTSQGRLRIELTGVGKRFGRHWIIREFSDVFTSGSQIGIRGRNGSGKSTLLRLLCGQLTPSRGQVEFNIDGKKIDVGQIYQHVSWTGPYLEIVEELTIAEFLRFHFTLKPLLPHLALAAIPAMLELDHVRNRKLSDCSSGMRQRVLLGSALYANTSLLLLDEPTVTLDEEAITWFQDQLAANRHDRLVVIASNDEQDLAGCERVLEL
ncbi:ABC transporter ATP-binding protein [Neolewinella persica]|uniref:ABC transporter ATP-binding protein n=1 Tax=Neolewinella persica TaxID=70998 RepID=UPI00037C863E|nr:ATP-binding cassette domain-containing protein [Neolewinella persica]